MPDHPGIRLIERLKIAQMIGFLIEISMRSRVLRMDRSTEIVARSRSHRRSSLGLESTARLELQRACVLGDDALHLFVDVVETADLDFQRHVRLGAR